MHHRALVVPKQVPQMNLETMQECMQARPGRLAGRLGEPSFTPHTEHNHTCGELENNSLLQHDLFN